MDYRQLAAAKADIEATQEAEPMVMTWAEWQASRAQKRATLAAYGLDAPSRRAHGYGSAEKRLQKAFGDARAPAFER